MMNFKKAAKSKRVYFGIVSGYLTTNSPAENYNNNLIIADMLKAAGFTALTEIDGWWDGNQESSIVVISTRNPAATLRKIIVQFNQESYILKRTGTDRASVIYRDGRVEDAGTYEELTPLQAAICDFKSSAPDGSFWRFSKENEKFKDVVQNESVALNEKMNFKRISETEYAKYVAAAYDNAPVHDATADAHWHALNQSNRKLFKRLLSKINVIFTTTSSDLQPVEIDGKSYEVVQMDDPYQSQGEMVADVEKNNRLYISKDHSDHPVFSEVDNIIFRTVHDYIVHILGKKQFGLHGELQAYNLHSKLVPEGAKAAVFTEVVGQVCWYDVHGSFPVQKVALLNGFDYDNLGYVSPEILNSVKTESTLSTKLKKSGPFTVLAKKHNISPTGSDGKFKLSDFDSLVQRGGKDLHDLAIILANRMLTGEIGLTWDDLADINSMHDYLKPKYNTVNDMLTDVTNAVRDRMESDMCE